MEQWQALARGPFFPIARLDCALGRLSGALICRQGAGKQLALPYAADRPFPLCELFCFARVASINGRSYVIYRFDAENAPIF